MLKNYLKSKFKEFITFRQSQSHLKIQLNLSKFNQNRDLNNKNYSTNLSKNQRISQTLFIQTTNGQQNYLFQELKLNKSLLVLYSMIHLPFYLISINFTFGLNFLDLDLIRIGIRSITLSQALITGINISSIIKQVEVNMDNTLRSSKIEGLDPEEFQKEITKTEGMIFLSFVPVVFNFIISQILVNYTEISTSILNLLTLGYITSNIWNLAILLVCVLKKSNLNNKYLSNSLLRINLLFALLNICAFIILMINLKALNNKTSKSENPFLTKNDENRIKNFITFSEYIKNDTIKIEDEISEILDEITPEQIELMEKNFNEEEKKI
jgi:hypothetical protein